MFNKILIFLAAVLLLISFAAVSFAFAGQPPKLDDKTHKHHDEMKMEQTPSAGSGHKHREGMKMKKTKKISSQKKMVKCPVLGTMMDPAKAYSKTVYKGKTYYFCCAGCPEEFEKNPEKYIDKK